MYTKENLILYPYFEKILQTQDITSITDSLTGLLSRNHMLGLMHHLISEGTPFTVALLDLDNFKFINDTMGHRIGDEVLAALGSNIIKFLDGYGLAGRYGGDEFLLINFRDLDYSSIKNCYTKMYTTYTVLRKNIELEFHEPFVTGTLGSATFPTDAADFETLFSLIDKTLYRGKSKGRNCYIIYVEELHRNIQMAELTRRGVSAICNDLAVKFDSAEHLHDKLESIHAMLCEDMRIANLFYVGTDYQIKAIGSSTIYGEAFGLEQLVTNSIYSTGNIGKFKEQSEGLHQYCKSNSITSILVVKISIRDEIFGYLICAAPNSRRIWQDDEEAILFFTARMIASHIKLTGETL